MDEHVKQKAAFAVRQRLEAKGLTPTRLADKTGYSPTQVSRIVAGDQVSPSLQLLIARIVGLDPETLWGDLWCVRRDPKFRAFAGCRLVFVGKGAAGPMGHGMRTPPS